MTIVTKDLGAYARFKKSQHMTSVRLGVVRLCNALKTTKKYKSHLVHNRSLCKSAVPFVLSTSLFQQLQIYGNNTIYTKRHEISNQLFSAFTGVDQEGACCVSKNPQVNLNLTYEFIFK